MCATGVPDGTALRLILPDKGCLCKKHKLERCYNMQKTIIFSLLILLTVGYIWGNSLKSVEQSAAQSAQVAEAVQPVVDPQEKIEKPVFHNFVRKMAHVTEFFVLGVFTAGFAISLGDLCKKQFVSLPILIVLLVAVGDEYIQHFSKRGSLVTDVVLDFSGSLAGLSAACLLFWGCKKVVHMIKVRRESVNG